MKTTINTVNKRLSVLNILMIIVIIMSVGKTHAQSKNQIVEAENEIAQSKHEVSVHLKGPFSGLKYKHDQDKQKLKSGFGFGIDYNYYLNPSWSLITGVEFQTFKGKVSYNSIEDAYQTIDAEGEAFEFRYAVQHLTEEQSAMYLNIPVKVQYESTGKIRFYAAGGVKIGLNIKSEYETAVSNLKTSGYYSQYDAELSAPEFMGFGQFADIKSGRKDLDLKADFGLDFESGVKFVRANNQAFYLGLFLDFGLKNLSSHDSQQNLIAYNPENPTVFKTESISTSTNNTKDDVYIDKINTIAFGFKIRYAFSL